MAGKRDFERLKRQQRTALARERRPLRPLSEIRQTLEFRFTAPEHRAGNWICLPESWDELVQAGRIEPYLEVHRKRRCLVAATRLNGKGGDRVVRLRDEDVELLGLPHCLTCAGFLH